MRTSWSLRRECCNGPEEVSPGEVMAMDGIQAWTWRQNVRPGVWAGLPHTLTCYWVLTSHRSLLAGQSEGLGPGPDLFSWPSVLSSCVCSLGGLNSPTSHRVSI